VRGVDGAPSSVFLAGWPDPVAALVDDGLVEEMAAVRRVVALGHQARSAAGVRVRQPLRRLVVVGAELAKSHADEIEEELRVKNVLFDQKVVTKVRLKPHLPALGPRLGAKLRVVSAAMEAGDYETNAEGVLVADEQLSHDEYFVAERSAVGDFTMAEDDGVTVALDTALDAELELEGRVYDLIHTLNSMRKDQGLELTDRIAVTLPAGDADLVERHAEWIKAEVLAVSLETDGDQAPQIAKV